MDCPTARIGVGATAFMAAFFGRPLICLAGVAGDVISLGAAANGVSFTRSELLDNSTSFMG